MVTTVQNHGQKPRGPRSLVAAKNERPVQTLYLMHSSTSAVSRTTEMVSQPVHVQRAAGGDVRQQIRLAAADGDAEVDRLRAEGRQHAREGQRERVGDLVHRPAFDRPRFHDGCGHWHPP
jgi:hypothetical protein